MGAIERVPYRDPEEIKRLPLEAQTMLSLVKNNLHLPKMEYRRFENQLIDIHQFSEESKKKKGKSKPVLSEKSITAGKLDNFGMQVINDLGAFNPDAIPFEVKQKMAKDPTIALGLNIIKCTVEGLNWRIDCDDEKQRELITKQIKPIYRKSIYSLTDAVKYGNAVGEKCWEESEEGGWKLKKIKFIHPTSYRMLVDKKGNFVGIIQRQFGEDKTIYANKLVLYSHNIEFGNFFGEARINNCYPAWYWSTVLTQFMLRYFERRAVPLTKLKAPPGTRTDSNGDQVDNMSHALKIGQAAVSSSIVVLPSEFNKEGKELWELEQVKDEQRGDMFMEILDFFSSRMLRGLFIPDKMGLASDGSKHVASGAGAGDTLDVFIMSEQALANDFEDIFNEQVIPYIQQYNIPKNQRKDACLRIEKLDYGKKLLLKETFLRMIMLAAGSIRDGRTAKILPSIPKLAEMLDIPVEDFNLLFDKMKMVPGQMPGVPTTGKKKSNVQNSPSPTVAKKVIQDKNNKNRATPRKERTGKERTIKDKRR